MRNFWEIEQYIDVYVDQIKKHIFNNPKDFETNYEIYKLGRDVVDIIYSYDGPLGRSCESRIKLFLSSKIKEFEKDESEEGQRKFKMLKDLFNFIIGDHDKAIGDAEHLAINNFYDEEYGEERLREAPDPEPVVEEEPIIHGHIEAAAPIRPVSGELRPIRVI